MGRLAAAGRGTLVRAELAAGQEKQEAALVLEAWVSNPAAAAVAPAPAAGAAAQMAGKLRRFDACGRCVTYGMRHKTAPSLRQVFEHASVCKGPHRLCKHHCSSVEC